MRNLSILIPSYNDICLPLVEELKAQADSIDGLCYEIIVADDGSTDENVLSTNRKIESLDGCSFIERGMNVGRAAIRNFLCDQAKYEWLLFIDGGHMRLCKDDFLSVYLTASSNYGIVYGGYCLTELTGKEAKANLRYKYEKKKYFNRSAKKRQKTPHADFHTSNFLVNREIMRQFRFDERYLKYGYEDVLLGKSLEEGGMRILHIDNPTIFCGYESNQTFLRKTQEAMHTLKDFKEDLYDYSRLLQKISVFQKFGLDKIIRFIFKVCNKKWIGNLEGSNPSITIFTLYKIGYLITLDYTK